MRIVRLANFVTPTSGGLRTALYSLGQGYAGAGHEPVLVIPGADHGEEDTPQGKVITLPGVHVPGLGGYRVMLRRRPLLDLLGRLDPDRLEVSDRTTLRWTGAWARAHGVPAVMVSHESLDGLLGVARLPGPALRWLAGRLNRNTARDYDRVICTTDWATREFDRIGVRNVDQVPLGVDLDLFRPDRRAPHGGPGVLLVCCVRLSLEKRPQRALTTLAALRSRGVDARLVIAGDGPLRERLEAEAAAGGLPVTFTGWMSDRGALADLLASADVVIAPGPVETFGLAALEALACGSPVVVSSSSALPGVVGDAGVAVAGEDMSAGVVELLGRPEAGRRAAARARAEMFGWDAAVRGFLAVHADL
ncbi:GDP-mannose-dependent alpha-(1-6)-phosphatidylinositol dimannoside mannosyltransferase [Longispora fulva]|uniref:Alpha-1,6-mannosyltransferase n=1 Tax=Longispora fulva TaxID=619741 RepID=A0A8J7KGT2_9ACTN|nr:glycosyltransferase [Longispora fulva]MBG6135244.1 alpha-1,6-mannosyltransferase [Longispora fulva]GIG56519.1 GDP-mannose-dependent alpha-(1-6)-phosphatidylinositol dimannoside mannosyltransferase [Longispora fulva]